MVVAVEAVRLTVQVVTPMGRLDVVAVPEADNRILECAVAAQAQYLVSGDKKHILPLRKVGDTHIVALSTFLAMVRE